MDKLITHILFLIALELNIVNIEKKFDVIHVGWQINLTMINPSQMKIALLIAMWNAIPAASLKQNKLMYWIDQQLAPSVVVPV